MQLFSIDAITILKKKCPWKHKEIALRSTGQSKIFSTANRPKTSPNLIFCTIKIVSRGTYIYK